MSRERELMVALAAMVEIVNKRAVGMTPEEVEVVYAAIDLIKEASDNCDECVDY